MVNVLERIVWREYTAEVETRLQISRKTPNDLSTVKDVHVLRNCEVIPFDLRLKPNLEGIISPIAV